MQTHSILGVYFTYSLIHQLHAVNLNFQRTRAKYSLCVLLTTI